MTYDRNMLCVLNELKCIANIAIILLQILHRHMGRHTYMELDRTWRGKDASEQFWLLRPRVFPLQAPNHPCCMRGRKNNHWQNCWVNLSTQIHTYLLLCGIYQQCWPDHLWFAARSITFHLYEGFPLPVWLTYCCTLVFDRYSKWWPIWSEWPGPAQISPGRWTKCTSGPESLNSLYIDRWRWLAQGMGEKITDKMKPFAPPPPPLTALKGVSRKLKG